MESLDLTKYLDMAARRIWWIIIPFLLTVLAGLAYTLAAPKIYEAQTLILVQPQRVPENFVRTIVSTTVENRLLVDDKVAILRGRIKVDVSNRGASRGEANSFTITFHDEDPRKVMEVTNALASNFIAENLRLRESQAMGTSTFLSDELESVERKLREKEEELKNYRERYMGGLPEQLETNLSIQERLAGQLDQLNSNLRDAENRKILVQTQMAEQRNARAGRTLRSTAREQEPRDITSLKNELASLESRYTQNHPDVISLKATIAKLEAEASEGKTSMANVDPSLVHQFQDIGLEIANLKEEISKVQTQVQWYQTKVEETPKREQELLALNRDYENLNGMYNSLLNRKLEAEIAVSMEKKQKGEQFRVIDPAKMPDRPVKPNIVQVIFLTLALGLGLGLGLAYLVEFMDTSYKAPEEVEKGLQLPVLVSLPIRYTESELRSIKMNKILTVVSVAVGFIVSAFGIVFAVKGMEGVMEFIKRMIVRV
jgi:polysaccharide chain length determinant protein (PEP-CTERM system associated)